MKVETVFSHHKAAYNIYHMSIKGGYTLRMVVPKSNMHNYGKLIKAAEEILEAIKELAQSGTGTGTDAGRVGADPGVGG